MIADLLVKAMTQGGPIALGVIGWIAWWYERRQNKQSTERLLELATAHIEATIKHEMAIQANTKLMEHFLKR